MTAFAILRIQKHSSLASLAGVARHHSRQSRARGCDPEKSPRNLSFGAACSGSAGVVAAVGSVIEQAQAKQSKAFRRDAVKAVEFMFTASPEWWKTASPKYRSAFFDRARRWLREKHPGALSLSGCTWMNVPRTSMRSLCRFTKVVSMPVISSAVPRSWKRFKTSSPPSRSRLAWFVVSVGVMPSFTCFCLVVCSGSAS